MSKSRQQELFKTHAGPYAEEACSVFAEVVFDRPIRAVFTYGVPNLLVDLLAPGKRVLAPFGKGNHRTEGFCVGVTTNPPQMDRIKVIAAVQDNTPLVSDSMLELTKWMSDYYLCGWGQALEAVLPRAVKDEKGMRWRLMLHPVPIGERNLDDLTTKQRRVYEVLSAAPRPMDMRELSAAGGCGKEVIKTLLAKGWLTLSKERDRRRALPDTLPVPKRPALKLSDPQHACVTAIARALNGSGQKSFLLHGVTGSGKTEVYLQAIGVARNLGKQAIVLVPEISLTPQTIQRFRERFDRVAVLHSRLSDVDRNAFWNRVADGEVDVVIGARSALFAPCPSLGIIVIDEEHEATFKQDSTPRYHARTVAAERCRRENAVLLLGSATPSLETWQQALDGSIELLSLPDRITGQKLPPVEIVDMRSEFKSAGKFRGLSRPLLDAISKTIQAGGQVILLLNRRGFSTSIFCPLCGECSKCHHCDIVLTFHREFNRLICHQCDAEYPVPERCSACQGQAIKFSGIGTEQLESEIRRAFPKLRIARMDGDTMRSLPLYEKTLGDFREGQTDLLLGTQMIAKGLDFPNVRLVGVVSADTALHLPDFRAGERTFQLVSQVAGRTGRGSEPGRVLVQTYCPDDRSIQCAARHDFVGFAAGEIPVRKMHGYPPFGVLGRIIVRSRDSKLADSAAAQVAQHVLERQSHHGAIRILGPAHAPIHKLQDYFRVHMQVVASNSHDLQKALDIGLAELPLPHDVELAIDVDPLSFL